MALTVLTAISRVLSRINEGPTPTVLPPDVEPLIPDALKKFAQIVGKDPDTRQLLRKDFSVAVVSGVGSLTASLTAAEPLLTEFLPSAHVVTANGVQLHYLPDRTQLNLARPTMLGYYINDESVLRTRNTPDGSLTSLNTTLTITGQCVLTIGDVPSQLEELYVDVLEGMVKERMAVPQGAANA